MPTRILSDVVGCTELLHSLGTDRPVTPMELAQRTGLPDTTCRQQLSRLESAGIVRRCPTADSAYEVVADGVAQVVANVFDSDEHPHARND